MASKRPASPTAPNPGVGVFDFDRGSFLLSPKLVWGLMTAAITIGGGIAANQYQLLNLGGAITEVRTEQAEIRNEMAAMVTKDQAYVQCLEQERANKGWRCPMALPIDKAKRMTRVNPERRPEAPRLPWPFDFGMSAIAKGK